MTAEELIRRGQQVIEAWKSFAIHAGACADCETIATYWRGPGRQSDWVTLANHHSETCVIGRPLFESWRFAIDELRGRRDAQTA